MKICQLLHRAYQKNDEEFIRDLFLQLLNREVDNQDVVDLLHLLHSGTPRISLIVGISCSHEAQEIYSRHYVWTGARQLTIADKLQQLFVLGNEDLIHHLYVEILGRYPESWGFEQFVQILERGNTRISVVSLILQSDEFIRLMQADRYYFTREILTHFFSTL